VNRSKEMLEKADFVLFMLDSTTALTADEKILLDKIKEKPHLIIVNKMDVFSENRLVIEDAVYISAQNSFDIKKLESEIINRVLKEVNISDGSTYLSNARQVSKLQNAINSLDESINAIKNNAFIDFVDIYLKEAYNLIAKEVEEY
jgi:tRNA modification GTPase